MKKILLTLVSLFAALSMSAIPAKPGPIRYQQPDGSVITIYRHGDEFAHWATDGLGRVVRKGADGYYWPVAGVTAEAARRQAAVRSKSMRQRHSYHPVPGIANGQKRFLVILVEFQDRKFAEDDPDPNVNPNADFSEMMNTAGYNKNGGTGSARDFYKDNSGGKFEPIFDVYGPVCLDNNYAYYGENDSQGYDLHPEDAVKEACEKLDVETEIDFSQYDNDGDGNVDLVFMYYAGYGEADSDDEDTIWPHQWELSSAGMSLTLDGKTIDSYACTNELMGWGAYKDQMCGIGTACHEFGHAMGLPDFYDTDYDTNDQAAALYEAFSTMDGGGYNNDGRTPPCFNIIERIMLGWVDEADALEEISQAGDYTLGPVTGNKAYKTLTDQDGEFFIYECRTDEGWDHYLPAFGMLVYRVDRSSRVVKIENVGDVPASKLWSDWGTYNAINENGSHPCFHIVPAVAQDDLLYGYTKHNGYYYFDWDGDGLAANIPFPGAGNVKTYTAKSWNGVDSDITLSEISYSGGKVTFTVAGESTYVLDYYSIQNPGGGVYAKDAAFSLKLNEPEGGSYSAVKWYYDDTEVTGASVSLTAAGWHTVEAVLTLPGGKTQTVTLDIRVE